MAKVNYPKNYVGRAKEPLSWQELLDIFDFIWTKDMRNLPHYPQVIGGVNASWQDEDNATHDLENIEELEQPYKSEKTKKIIIANYKGDIFFQYIPSIPSVIFSMISEDKVIIDKIETKIKQFFPITDKFLFVSYGTQDIKLAKLIVEIVEKRLGAYISVFLAKRDIKPGENPFKKMVEEQLLHAEALLAICTPDSLNSQWLAWESSSVWTREKLVIPLYANINPTDFRGPISTILQGRNVFDRDDLNEVIKELYEKILSRENSQNIGDEEWQKLMTFKEQNPRNAIEKTKNVAQEKIDTLEKEIEEITDQINNLESDSESKKMLGSGFFSQGQFELITEKRRKPLVAQKEKLMLQRQFLIDKK